MFKKGLPRSATVLSGFLHCLQSIMVVQPLPFPAWSPGSQDVICAKFIYFYEEKCFHGHVQKLEMAIEGLKGTKRLQMTCWMLKEALGGCLKYFNQLCSTDLLHTGQNDFTPAVLAPASKPALAVFRDKWISDGRANTGLDLNLCTSFGGLCEHPDQLSLCAGGSGLLASKPLVFIVTFCVVTLGFYCWELRSQ